MPETPHSYSSPGDSPSAPLLPSSTANGIIPAGRNGEAPRSASEPTEDVGSKVGRWLAVRGMYLGILALLWVVAVLSLSLYGLRIRSAIGFATVFSAVAAFFVRSLVPLASEKTQAASAASAQPTDSFREVVETVVFVVVLVLLLKSFVAEAFVIPTGSMAETLLGYQKWVKCPQCSEYFPVNCSQEVDPSEGNPEFIGGCTCPNCRQRIHLLRGQPEPAEPMAQVVSIPDPGWSSGDRVLVAKFVYDLLNRQPNRLDVVVFKFPGDADFPASGPVKKHVPMNYIKRLVGEPGETIAIYKGKLYVLPADKNPTRFDDFEKAREDNTLTQLWRPEHMHQDELVQQFKQPDSRFEIIRKSPETLLAMMRLVYDNDHQATDLKDKPEYQRWVPVDNSGWTTTGPAPSPSTVFHNDGSNKGKDTAWLRYRHVLRGDEPRPQVITTFMGYNSFEVNRHPGSQPDNWASDLIVECEAKIDRPEGNFLMELSRGQDRFQAQFDLADGTCTLFRIRNGKKQTLESKPSRLKERGTHQVRFANVDDRLVVWVDERLVFGDGVSYEMAKYRDELAPTKENDLERPVSIGSQGAAVLVSKLKVFRDTYYTTQRNRNPNAADVTEFVPNDPQTFRHVATAAPATYYVQPDHYLCLGDNSPESSDGRTWGLVPRRLLLGRALLVYYPFDRAGRIR